MRTTIDKAGRLVIPKALRDSIGFTAGEVELTTDGAAIRITPISTSALLEKAGRVVIAAQGRALDDQTVQDLRDAGQR